VRRVTGADVVFERDAATGLWTAPLPAGWIFVTANHGRRRENGFWSSEFIEIAIEDHFHPADRMRALYAADCAEPLPDDWRAPNNLWAVVHRYALVPRERVDLVPQILAWENMNNGYPALALPGETEEAFESRVGITPADC
jgi:hypothetical protein